MITETCITFTNDAAIDAFAADLAAEQVYVPASRIAAEVRAMVAECGVAIFAGNVDAEVAAMVGMRTDGCRVVSS